MSSHGVLYHGGVPGLHPGDVLVPGRDEYLDDCPVCQARKRGDMELPSFVFATPVKRYARVYAAGYGHGGGDVYEVTPIGECTLSDEDAVESWQAPAFRIKRIVEARVSLTGKEAGDSE